MKKIISIALVVLILGSITVFAMGFNPRRSVIDEEYNDRFGRGFGYGMGHMYNDEESLGYGHRQMFSDDEFIGYGPNGYMYSENLMEEFDIDEEEFYEYMEERHKDRIEYFVEEGILTEEEGQEALENFEGNFNSVSGQFLPRGRSFGPGACFRRY